MVSDCHAFDLWDLQEPEKRLDAIRAAGEAEVPFTSGLLIGIGETREERIHALLQLQDIHAEYGHLEVSLAKHACCPLNSRF